MSHPEDLRIDELESRLAFLDDTVEQLNAVIVRQDQDIRLMQQQLVDLTARLADLGGTSPENTEAQQHEIPPHY